MCVCCVWIIRQDKLDLFAWLSDERRAGRLAAQRWPRCAPRAREDCYRRQQGGVEDVLKLTGVSIKAAPARSEVAADIALGGARVHLGRPGLL